MWFGASRPVLLVVSACFLLSYSSSLAGASDVPDFFVGGDFLVSVLQETGELSHAAGIAGFQSDGDKYVPSVTAGGVTMTRSAYGPVHPSILQCAPTGVFAIGEFEYVGKEYSQAVGMFDSSANEWHGLNGGIWTAVVSSGPPQSVSSVSSIGDLTVFGGSFSIVEAYMAWALEQNATATVQNLVTVDSANNWAPLPAWELKERDTVTEMVTSSTAAELYIMSGGDLYSYSNDTVSVVDSTDTFSPGSLAVTTNGDLYAITLAQGTGQDTYLYNVSVAYFRSGNPNPLQTLLKEDDQCSGINIRPVVAVNRNELFIAMPDDTDGCMSYSFFTASGTNVRAANIPSLTGVQQLAAGQGNAMYALATRVYYSSNPSSTSFEPVSLSSIGISSYNAYAITFDDTQQQLLVYGYNRDTAEVFLAAIKGSQVSSLNTGNFAVRGSVEGMAEVRPGDGTVDIYVSGTFDIAGLGDGAVTCDNFAVLHGAGRGWEGLSAPFAANNMASSGSTVFVSGSSCAGSGDELVITSFDADKGQFVELPGVPTSAGQSLACIQALAVNDGVLFVGGDFAVTIPACGEEAYAVVAYDIATQQWTSVGVPATITSPSGSPNYGVTSFSFYEDQLGTHVLLGGIFSFIGDGFQYNSLAMVLFESGTWESTAHLQAGSAILAQSSLGSFDQALLGGSNLDNGNGVPVGVQRYDFAANDIVTVGTLQGKALTVLLYSTPNDYAAYAGGQFREGLLCYRQGALSWIDPTNVFMTPDYTVLFSGGTSVLLGPPV